MTDSDKTDFLEVPCQRCGAVEGSPCIKSPSGEHHLVFVHTRVDRGTRVECRSTRETSRERERWIEYGWKFL